MHPALERGAAAAHPSETRKEGPTAIRRRGGRMTKWKGRAASYAPEAGFVSVLSAAWAGLAALASSASPLAMSAAFGRVARSLTAGAVTAASAAAIALPALIVTTSGADAQDACGQGGGGSPYTCDVDSTTTQMLAGSPLIVTVNEDVTINTTSTAGNAFDLTGTGGLTFAQLGTSGTGGDIIGVGSGINAINSGAGALTITATGSVTGINERGISAITDGTGLSITAVDVSGVQEAIFALNNGAGMLQVSTSGSVESSGLDGIFTQSNAGGDIVIDAGGNVAGGRYGIFAQANNSSDIQISAAGTVTGQAAGIFGQLNGAGNLTIEAQNRVTGQYRGIFGQVNGDGNLVINAERTVTGNQFDGVSGQINGGGNLSINAQGAVTGGYRGVVGQTSDGDVTITTSGIVTGRNGDGIFGQISSGDGKLTIDAQDAVSGESRGIFGQIDGDGDLTITTAQSVNGNQQQGIFGQIFGENGDVTIVAYGDVSGGSRGVEGDGSRSGSVSITTYGKVQGGSSYGVFGNGSGFDGGDVDIVTLDDVTGGTRGIFGQNGGTGNLTITSSGAVTGQDGYGIFGFNQQRGVDLTMTVRGDVAGTTRGVFGLNEGSGTLSTTVSAAVAGDAGTSIFLLSEGGGDNRLELQPGWATNEETLSFTNGEDSRLVFGGDASLNGGVSSFDLARWDDGSGPGPDGTTNRFFGFDPVLLKEDTSTFVITDDLGPVTVEFDSALVDEGVLILDDATVTMASGFRTFDVAAGATLGANGMSRIDGSLTNDGTVDLSSSNGTPDTVLTIENYWSDDGRLIIDTVLGDDGSDTDILVVEFDLVGSTTSVFVNNVGGTGAQTMVGIEVVDVRLEPDGQFVLGNPDFVIAETGEDAIIAGAYGYALRRGDGMGRGNPDSWYLQSTLEDGRVVLQPGAPVYESLPSALGALNTLPTLQQRVGNRYWQEPGGLGPMAYAEVTPASTGLTGNLQMPDVEVFPADMIAVAPIVPLPALEPGVTIEQSAIWARIEGAHAHVDPDVSTTGAQYDVNHWQLRSGIDGLLAQTDAGKLIGGVNAFYGQSRLDVHSAFGDGAIDTTGYGVAATLTWYGENGFYLDGQAQYQWFDSDLGSDVLGALADDVDGTGYALSAEIGQRLELSETLTLIPQAQLTYASVDFGSFVDPFGASVSLSDGDSLRGRLGLALEHQDRWLADDGTVSRSSVYGIANLTYEFLDGTTVDVSGTAFDMRPDRWTGEMGLGGTVNWNDDRYSIHGEVSAATSLANFADSHQLKGNIGFRVKW